MSPVREQGSPPHRARARDGEKLAGGPISKAPRVGEGVLQVAEPQPLIVDRRKATIQMNQELICDSSDEEGAIEEFFGQL